MSDQGGNNALAFSDLDFNNVVNTTEVTQQTHFYPFGMQMYGLGTTVIGVENKYKFAGKELQDEFNLQQYDFGARYYDPAVARWNSPDPVADMATDWTPFRYGFNNPLTFSDPSGMMETTWDGQTVETGTITPKVQAALDIANKNCSGCYVSDGKDGIVKGGGGGNNSPTLVSTPSPVSAPTPNSGPSNNNTSDNHTNEVNVSPESLGGLSNGGEAPNISRETSSMVNQLTNKSSYQNNNNMPGNSGSDNATSRAAQIMASTLLLTASTIELPPAAIPILVVGGITAGAIYIYDKIAGKGNANYPGPLSYTHLHPSQDPINNPMNNFDPEKPSGVTLPKTGTI